jgi:RNA polymerase sigma-70 factor (ECF subfamily)
MKDEGQGRDDIVSLVKASKAGDQLAFGQLVRWHQRPALRVALGILGNVDDAAEVVQEAFVKGYLRIGSLTSPERFKFWILKIVAHEAISRQRLARRRALTTKLFATNAMRKRAGRPDEQERAEDLRAAIERAMVRLTEKEAKAVVLSALDNLPHQEVARIMGCSTGAVRWHVHRARQKLRMALKEYLE